MKITKFGHSCVLIETDQRVGIFDPGDWSLESNSFKIDDLKKLDDILITHEHEDHMSINFIQTLVDKFPQVKIVATAPAVEKLKAAGFQNISAEPHEGVVLFSANHESIEPLGGPPPANIGIHYRDIFTSPGDSHHFTETKKILAVPITAPWGSTARAAAVIEELKPEYVIPVHDWLWRDEIRASFYTRFDAFCKELGVKFLSPVDGQPIEIDL